MTTLSAFMLARIVEDEERATWHHRLLCLRTACDAECCWGAATDEQIAAERVCTCGYPSRLQAECGAKRRIVEDHFLMDGGAPETYPYMAEGYGEPRIVYPGCAVCHRDASPSRHGCDTVRVLAVPYADHPDYLEEWRP